jgi:calcineurin-like phosphoesterase family protein
MKNKQKTWITTDTHFNHERLKTLGRGRPDDYEERILESMRQNIKPGDTFIHLGDICMGDDSDAHFRMFVLYPLLNIMEDVQKVLVRGNHDHKSYSWYKNHGWDVVCEAQIIRHHKKRILLSHIPFLEKHVRAMGCDYHFHGHFHGTNDRANRRIELYNHNFHFDVAPDNNEFKIYSLDEVCEIMERRNMIE